MKIDKDQLIEYLDKFDTSIPGLYVARLKENVPDHIYKRILDELNKAIQKYSVDSTFLLLDKRFDPIFTPDDKTMERLGWVREKDVDEDEILDEIMEKAYSIDGKKINSLNGVNK